MNKKELVVTALGGRIERVKTDGKGMITSKVDNREDVTEEVLRAANEWFMVNDHTMIGHRINDEKSAYLIHTTDRDKKQRIVDILKDEDQ